MVQALAWNGSSPGRQASANDLAAVPSSRHSVLATLAATAALHHGKGAPGQQCNRAQARAAASSSCRSAPGNHRSRCARTACSATTTKAWLMAQNRRTAGGMLRNSCCSCWAVGQGGVGDARGGRRAPEPHHSGAAAAAGGGGLGHLQWGANAALLRALQAPQARLVHWGAIRAAALSAWPNPGRGAAPGHCQSC